MQLDFLILVVLETRITTLVDFETRTYLVWLETTNYFPILTVNKKNHIKFLQPDLLSEWITYKHHTSMR